MSTSEAPKEDRWQAPDFPQSGMLTAADLEALQEQAYEEARAEGMRKGLEEGREQGLAEAGRELAARRGLLEATLEHLAAPLEALDDALESQLARMVTVMVGRMFKRQLELDPDSIVGLVRDAVDLLPVAASQITVHLHPEDAERLEAILGRDATPEGDDAGSARWRLVRDAALTRGGCHITSESSNIDARVESRIATMVNALMGDQRQ